MNNRFLISGEGFQANEISDQFAMTLRTRTSSRPDWLPEDLSEVLVRIARHGYDRRLQVDRQSLTAPL